MIIIKEIKLIALSILATAACAFAFQANQANVASPDAVIASETIEPAPVEAPANTSFWNVVGSKAYMSGESGVNEPNEKPSYDDLARAWVQ